MRARAPGAMFYMLLAIWLLTEVAATCPPGEYEIDNVCCPMCNIGTVVKAHCTSDSTSNVCVPCMGGTYMDHPNGVNKCLKCTECDTGAGLLEKKKCSGSSNTECECRPGHYCSSSSRPCDLCIQYTICDPGEYVKVAGTPKTNNVCEKCPEGSFSVANMTDTCTPWTKCSEEGRVEIKQGTSTSDSTCRDKRSRLGIPVAICTAFALLFLCSKYFCKSLYKPESKEKFPTPPVQEENPG